MIVHALSIPAVKLCVPQIFPDDRGVFFESYNAAAFGGAVGVVKPFIQDNESFSHQGVLRGLHYQRQFPQGKLVRAVVGEIFDVAVDLRRPSATFGHSVTVILSGENRNQLWIPEGFAHGFLVLSDHAIVQYKVNSPWVREDEQCLRYDDPNLGIPWPTIIGRMGNQVKPHLSSKDLQGRLLAEALVFDGL
jgi:dTDP-4-dehydrorhamnose 3,5-epimerase